MSDCISETINFICEMGLTSLSIAAYGFLVVQQIQQRNSEASKKNSAHRHDGAQPALPTHYKPRGSPAHAAPRPIIHHELTAAYRSSLATVNPPMPMLPALKRKASFLTQ